MCTRSNIMRLSYGQIVIALTALVFLWPIHFYVTLVLSAHPKGMHLGVSLFNLVMIGVLFMQKWQWEQKIHDTYNKFLKSLK